MATSPAIHAIAAAYGLHPIDIATAERGYRNHSYAITLVNGRRVNLIQYKREAGIAERIQRLSWLGSGLATHGLPVRAPADPRILQAKGRATTYFGLYNYLPGRTIPWDTYTQTHLKLTGLALGRLHQAMASLKTPPSFQAYQAADELRALQRRMANYFVLPEVREAVQQKLRLRVDQTWLTNQADFISMLGDLPRQQPLHLDFVRSNLLFAPAGPTDILQFEGLALTGIIDFEKAAWGHPVIDQARTLAFLLVDCQFKTPRQVRKYFLQSGYAKRGGGVVAREHLEALVNFFLFYDFYKFLRHNPYESLKHNQHFRRTLTELMLRQIVR